MVLLGFGGAPSRTAEGKRRGQAYLDDALVAGKRLGEDTTNGASARPGSKQEENLKPPPHTAGGK